MTKARAIYSKYALAIWTFVAIVVVIGGVALVVIPMMLKRYERQYHALVHQRLEHRARALSRFAERQLSDGRDPKDVLVELQWIVTAAKDANGFSAVVDRNTSTVVCHPDESFVGFVLQGDISRYALQDRKGKPMPMKEIETWDDIVDSTGFGALVSDDVNDVIMVQFVIGQPWVVVSASDTDRIQANMDATRAMFFGVGAVLAFVIAIPASVAARRVSARYERRIEARERKIREERAKSDALLRNILPEKVADRLKAGDSVIAERHEDVAILFADLVGFTDLAGQMNAARLVPVLNEIFSGFDELADAHGVEKIKTIGDAYMACGGLPTADPEGARKIASMALDMFPVIDAVNRRHDLNLELRVGIHSGEVVAGVIGKRKFIYDLWGAAVNTASRLESSSVPGRIQVSAEVRERLGDGFSLDERGEIELKGVGAIRTWFLTGRARKDRAGAEYQRS
ncbi:adenylate/guanylate cyclase domain-containing protein [Sulfuriroseicoccus oceanibius]|uniref:Adenylate cyclase n=1 Tax=Sulfuriroseicoccus oceanibius TaxID=2707525 RepID=A0A6B3L8Z9_9BACT|nr:adenylate/guanylate cyclase domain-containing protein [Sulfuriroseicoccus oceanibius]QQL44141.1 hypothetical protein G3M56_009560 [Sulfuriroseicoccus oceanibius]